jgi:ABC-type sugar transport system permease subunit
MKFKKRILTTNVKDYIEGSLFIAPWIVGFILFLALPLGYSLYLSFHKVRMLPSGIELNFIGFAYYREILIDSTQLHNELIPFLREVVIMIPIILIFALLIAILLNQKFIGRFFFRAVFFLPVIFTTGYVVTEFITQGQGGLGFLDRFNVEGQLYYYLGENIWTKTIIEILSRFILVLWYSGVQILIFLAGRQTISGSVYESARRGFTLGGFLENHLTSHGTLYILKSYLYNDKYVYVPIQSYFGNRSKY